MSACAIIFVLICSAQKITISRFVKDLDEQLQAIQNPFVEPVFVTTKMPGAIGTFDSAVLLDSVLFTYPRNHPSQNLSIPVQVNS